VTCEELDARLRAWQVYAEKPDWLDGERGLEPCIAEGLDANRAAGDWLTFSKYVIAALRHPSAAYSPTLCAVLDERRDDVNSEDLIEAIEDGRDPAAIPSLQRAITWSDDSDEFGQLQRKAVLALGHIGTPEALAAIRETVTPDMPEKVVEAAERVLADADG
jgi:HEAT repeat protein